MSEISCVLHPAWILESLTQTPNKQQQQKMLPSDVIRLILSLASNFIGTFGHRRDAHCVGTSLHGALMLVWRRRKLFLACTRDPTVQMYLQQQFSRPLTGTISKKLAAILTFESTWGSCPQLCITVFSVFTGHEMRKIYTSIPYSGKYYRIVLTETHLRLETMYGHTAMQSECRQDVHEWDVDAWKKVSVGVRGLGLWQDGVFHRNIFSGPFSQWKHRMLPITAGPRQMLMDGSPMCNMPHYLYTPITVTDASPTSDRKHGMLRMRMGAMYMSFCEGATWTSIHFVNAAGHRETPSQLRGKLGEPVVNSFEIVLHLRCDLKSFWIGSSTKVVEYRYFMDPPATQGVYCCKVRTWSLPTRAIADIAVSKGGKYIVVRDAFHMHRFSRAL